MLNSNPPHYVQEMRILSVCPHDCPDTCSMLTTVEGGVAVRVQGNPAHAATDGVLCHKVSRYTERTYHPERLLYPMRRVGEKGEGRFERVSWEQAVADITARLGAIAQRNPEAILPYSYAGTMGKVQGEAMASRFLNALGASQLYRSICAEAGAQALEYTYGKTVGMRIPHFADSRLILIWGSNPITSSVHFWRVAQDAKRKGAKLICIDPRKSETAEKCHEHLAILPGTDAALALGLMHELIVHDAEWQALDHAYLHDHTLGWDELRGRALEWPPARVAAVCGISEAQITQLAHDYGHLKPAAIRLNYGMQRTRGGGNAVRAVACLPALIGAWRDPAGGLLLSNSGNFQFDNAALERPDLRSSANHSPKPSPRSINMSTIGQDLNNPEQDIAALIVYNSNPLAIAPDSQSVARGLAREDLFTVVLEHFQTDTVDYADYLLPATTQLEHWDIHKTYGHTDILLNRPAIAPVGEALPNAEIFRRLAKVMSKDFPALAAPCFADSDEALCRQALGTFDNADEIWQTLLEQGFYEVPLSAAPFASGAFLTPSGKCEFFSPRLQALGQDGLPNYLANHEGPSQTYPLRMISPPARNFMNSTFANVESLAQKEGAPHIEINPEDALARGIAHGAMVRVFNNRGEYLCQANISERAREGVIHGLGVWWRKQGAGQTNVNELSSQALTDIGEAATFYDCVVEVEAVVSITVLNTIS